jgi:hypothetical protein
MRQHLHLAMILTVLSVYAGFAISACGNTSFEAELIRAEMHEAGPQFEAALARSSAQSIHALRAHT